MIYPTPRRRLLADSYLGIEFGDDADLRTSFRVIALTQAFRAQAPTWALEIVPTLREFGVVYDRAAVELTTVCGVVDELLPAVTSVAAIRSRLFKLPVWYRDPWSEAINRRAGLEPSIAIVAQANGCSVDDVIARHSGTDHFVSCVGWAPGCYFAYPIERARGVTAPKLVTARPYTPARILTLGGLCTAALPFAGPSGYQMLGRLAAPTYQAQPTLSGFPSHGVPFAAGDRHRYVPVDALGYEAVREQVAAGSFAYEMSGEWFALEELVAGGYRD